MNCRTYRSAAGAAVVLAASLLLAPLAVAQTQQGTTPPAAGAAKPAAKPGTTANASAKPSDNPAAKPGEKVAAAKPAAKRGPRITDTKNSCALDPAKPYFVEFRSRMAVSYGHAFVVFGRLNAAGHIERADVAGLHPAGDDPSSWLAGHVVPVKSETGPSIGDLEEKYVSARYCVNLGEAEFRKVSAYIRHKQATSPVWYANTTNCVAFIQDIAQSMGLKASGPVIQYPEVFVNNLRAMNGSANSTSVTLIPYNQWGMEAPKEIAKINDGLRR